MTHDRRDRREALPITAAERARAPLWAVGSGVVALLLVLLFSRVLDPESKATALWLNGRYLAVGLLAWSGWLVGVGRGRVVAENIEILAISIVMALILKYFLVEAYKIPTGSMQPTILGNAETGIFDRVLVNKFAYRVSDPHRYDVIVFKYPLDRSKQYIKRLVGLPGERLMIYHGDIFVGESDGKGGHRRLHIARKPPGKRDAVLRRLFPDGGSGHSFSDAFEVVRGAADGDGDRVTLAPGSRVRFGHGESIRNRYLDGYDPDWGIRRPAHVPPFGTVNVSDLSLSLTAKPLSGCRFLRLTIFADGIEHRATLPVGQPGRAVLECGYRSGEDALLPVVGDSSVVASREGVALPEGEAMRVCFLHVDQRLELDVGGETLLRFDYEIALEDGPRDDTLFPPPRSSENEVSFEIGGSGGLEVADLTVARDTYYLTTNGADRQVFEVPADSFMVLGDNTQNSSDSRLWRAEEVRLPDGRTTWRERSEAYGQLRRDFVDIFGEHYLFPTGPAPQVHPVFDQRFSFVPRRLLLGKAFAVLWPIWPHFRWKLIR